MKAADADLESEVSPKLVSNWLTGEFFGLLNQSGLSIEQARITPEALASLIQMVAKSSINQNTAKNVLREMFDSGKSANEIVAEENLQQISDSNRIAEIVKQVLAENPSQVGEYLDGKDTIAKWLFGQVMRAAKGQANPQVVQAELDQQLAELRER